ncbi:MAG: hypothetical protein ACKO7B_04050 [Flavobacteriales bacterium]
MQQAQSQGQGSKKVMQTSKPSLRATKKKSKVPHSPKSHVSSTARPKKVRHPKQTKPRSTKPRQKPHKSPEKQLSVLLDDDNNFDLLDMSSIPGVNMSMMSQEAGDNLPGASLAPRRLFFSQSQGTSSEEQEQVKEAEPTQFTKALGHALWLLVARYARREIVR